VINKLSKSIKVAIVGLLSFLIALLFLEKEIIAGIMSLLAMLLYIIAFRLTQNKKQFIIVTILMALGYTIRFFTLFDNSYILKAAIFICLVIYSFFLSLAFVIEKKLKSSFIYPFIYPTYYTLLIIVVVLLMIGNIHNFTIYFMCLPYISLNLSLFGEYGMTFIVSLLLSLLAEFFLIDKKKKIRYISSIIIIVFAMLISGYFLSTKISDEPDFYLKVALATCEEQDFLGNRVKECSEDEYRKIFLNAVKKASEGNADLLVTNEEFCNFDLEMKERLLKEYALFAKEYRMPMLVCSDTFVSDNEKRINDAIFIDENGEIITIYIKNYLVPFIESGYYENGDGYPGYFTHIFNNHKVNVSLAICFDIDSSFLINKMNEDTQLLIVPSWNWNSCNIEQKRTHIRSIEQNITILNHTFEGFSYVSGPNGLIGDYIDNRNQYETVEFIDVPIWDK